MTAAFLLATTIGLFFSVTNLVPISAIPSVLCLLLFGLVVFARQELPAITKWAVAYYAISLISILAYWPASLLAFDFYRYDGNFILSFAPLLILPLVRTEADIAKLLLYFLLSTTAIDVIADGVKGLAHLGIQNGLFVANNAFGGFLMFTSAIAFVWWRTRRDFLSLSTLVVNLGLMAVSYSRGSELGLMAGIICTACLKRQRGKIVFAMISAVVLIEAAILTYTYPIYVRAQNVMNLIAATSTDEKQANILIRAYENWPRGLFAFFHSPIFGSGFGSVNDIPFKYDSNFALFQFNKSSHHIFSSSHAHNTYIHILGEQGLVGLLVFLGFWRAVYVFIRNSEELPLVRDTLMISFWALTFASFTEHRIPSPSNAFPFTLTLMLYYAHTARKREGAVTSNLAPQPSPSN